MSPTKYRLADRDVRRVAQAVTDLKSAEPRGNSTDLRKLLESVNSASQAARNAWLGYPAVLSFLLVTLAGVTHKDLLFNTRTSLPFADIDIPIVGILSLAPTVLLFLYFGLLLQHHMLYEKLINLRHELPPETDEAPDLRDEIHSYFFTQAVVGRRRDRGPILIAYRAMLFVTLTAAPLVLLLYIQASSLPFHSETMTWWHRVHVIGGVALLYWLGRDLRLVDHDLRGASSVGVVNWIGEKIGSTLSIIRRTALNFGQSMNGQLRCLRYRSSEPHERVTDWLWYDVPIIPETRATADNFGQVLFRLTNGICAHSFARLEPLARSVRKTGVFVSSLVFLSVFATSIPDQDMDIATAQLFPKWLIPIDDWVKLIGGNRNLVVTDQDLVKDKELVKGSYVHFLRGRDLRYADFSRSDLKQSNFENAQLQHANLVSTDLKGSLIRSANLQGANLRGASLQGASLRGASLQGANLRGASLQDADLGQVSLQGADLGQASLQGADLRAASLQGANLRRASLHSANLRWASLQGADLRWASLQGADLRVTRLQGADLRVASLQGANLLAARLQGANLRGARLQGADLRGARLQGANLREANLQGADLRRANLQGANLRQANLQGADLRRASLQGAELRGARLQGADLRGARIWLTRTNVETTKSSFDARTINIDWPDGEAQAKARGAVSGLTRLADAMQREKSPGFERVAAARDHVTQTLASLLKLPTRRELIGMKENMCTLHALRNRVPSIDKAATGPESRATILADIACDDTTDNANVARNITRRISSDRDANADFARTFLNALDNKLCHHIHDKLPKPLLRDLQKRAAEERSQPKSEELPIRPKDAADYYCTTPSKPGQLPIPEGPPY
ncbi:MAG: pentapeptide repeat-containing protein [Hyphomicrobiaceae bacterium]